MDLFEFLDYDDDDHIQAIRELLDTGTWPAGFLPDDITFPSHWFFELTTTLTLRYIALRLNLDLRR